MTITECRIVGFTECEDDDGLDLETFVAQDCQPGTVKILSETKKVPECNPVTCVTPSGPLTPGVWAGNENCKDVT